MYRIQEKSIYGITIKPLKQIIDERGKIMHLLRRDDPEYEGFGEIYFSVINPGVVKGWHIHSEMTLNYAVIEGNIKLVLYDERNTSLTQGLIQEIYLGPDNYYLVKIPPMIWNGFKGIGVKPAIVANCSTMAHSPSEIERLDPFNNHIPYDWSLINK